MSISKQLVGLPLMKGLSWSVVSISILSGCASNPGVVQTSPGVYLISREDKAGIFGNPSAMKADVIKEANEFAAKQGKVAIAVSTNSTGMYPGHFATFDYQFKLVDPNGQEAKATSVLLPTPNVRTQVDVHNHESQPASLRADVYGELVKLDDLHKKGILSDAEFEAQKKKILDQNRVFLFQCRQCFCRLWMNKKAKLDIAHSG